MIKYLSRPFYAIVIILTVAFITRIPQLINPELILDGDECVVGLMGKHMYEGKEVPVYFYGQSYGFSLPETAFVAAGFATGGISDYSVKLSMLCLWLIGVVFFYYSLRAVNNNNGLAPFIITLLLVLCPAWSEWSMKARGGYITSFVLSFIVTWLLFDRRSIGSIINYIIIGFLLFVIYKSQPLWLPGLLPLVVYQLMTGMARKQLLYFTSGLVTAAVLFYFLSKNVSGFWNPHIFDADLNKEKLAGIPAYILLHLTGAYYYPDAWVPAIVFAWLVIAVMIFFHVVLIYELIKGRKQVRLFTVLCLSIVLTLSYTLVLNEYPPRYLLPLSGFVFIGMTVFKWQRYRIIALTGVIVLIITGSITLYNYRHFRINMTPKKDLLMSIEYLKQHGTPYVFCTGSVLQWQVMFYSNEEIIARFVYPTDRYMPYVERVNKALATERNRTSIYGFSIETLHLNTDSVTFLSDKYFVVPAPDSALLLYTGFQL